MIEWAETNWWFEMITTYYDDTEITREVCNIKKNRTDKKVLANEAYDFVVFVSYYAT